MCFVVLDIKLQQISTLGLEVITIVVLSIVSIESSRMIVLDGITYNQSNHVLNKAKAISAKLLDKREAVKTVIWPSH